MDVEDMPAEFAEENAATREYLAVEAQAVAAKRQRLADATPKAAGRPKAAGPPLGPLTSPLLPKADPPGTYVDETSADVQQQQDSSSRMMYAFQPTSPEKVNLLDSDLALMS